MEQHRDTLLGEGGGLIYKTRTKGGHHLADNNPMAKVRDEVGKYSTERQSREFQPI